MTRWIVQIGIRIVVILALALAATTTLSHQLPPRDTVPRYGLAECQYPCWAGITVGQTPSNDVETLLRNALPDDIRYTSKDSLITGWNSTSNKKFFGRILYYEGKASGINVYDNLPLAWFMLSMGPPKCVGFTEDEIALYITWELPSTTITAYAPVPFSARWGIFVPVTQYQLLGTSELHICGDPVGVPWKGFIPYCEYNELAGELWRACK